MLFVGGGFARGVFCCVTALSSSTEVLTCAQSWPEEGMAQKGMCGKEEGGASFY